jgi:hypothetical protein
VFVERGFEPGQELPVFELAIARVQRVSEVPVCGVEDAQHRG